jgi:uncharacterized protein YjgD (DUF1641 family)
MGKGEREGDLNEALDFVSQEARHYVLDAVYGTLANAAGTLKGNTEKSDVEWFATRMYECDNGSRLRWDLLEEDQRENYRKNARLALQVLPLLTERIADRYRAYTDALNIVLRAEREEVYKRRR